MRWRGSSAWRWEWGHIDYCCQQRWRDDYHLSADAVDRQGGRGGLSDLSGRKALSLGAPRAESTSRLFRRDDAFRQPRFRQGLLVSLFNPKPIVFFMALFPQFIHPQQPFIPQFSVLSITFCILVVSFIHSTAFSHTA
jgi:hypothetical protein